jgi:protein-S-isoprenylcysteine O-methyltransferase Ste14
VKASYHHEEGKTPPGPPKRIDAATGADSIVGMFRRMAAAILLLPMNVLVVIPALLAWLLGGSAWGCAWPGAGAWQAWLAVGLFAPAIACAIWTMVLFLRMGRGTPAPWDPPTQLVIGGPYRYMRNPMITSVFVMLAAEALFFASPALATEWMLFLAANLLYIPLVEEKRLRRRFGTAYEKYRRRVPRWIPRLTPWTDSPADRTSP